MKKHLRFLLTLLVAMVGMGAWAQFDASKTYTLGTARGYLPNHANMTNLWGANYIVSTTNVDEAGKFRLIEADGGYQLYNTDVEKYLSADGTPQTVYVDEANGTFSFEAAENHGGNAGMWIIKSNVTGKWMMFGGSNQFLNNDGWSAADDGDQWTVEAVVPAVVPLYTVNAKSSDLTFEEDGEEMTLPAYVGGEVQLDVYEGYAIIHNALGMEGAEMKVVYSEYDENMERNEILALELNGVAGSFDYDEEEGYYLYTDGAGTMLVVSPQWAVINEQKGNITMVVMDFASEEVSAYYLVWGESEQPGEGGLLYSATGETYDYEDYDAFGYSNAFPNVSDIKVESYEGYVILRGWAGTEGFDLKLSYDGAYTITGVTPIYGGVEQETVTEGVATVYADRTTTYDIALLYSFIYDMGSAEEGGYAVLVNTTDYSYYCIAWGEDEAEEPLYTLNGTVLSEPNAYVSELLGLDELGEDVQVISMSDPASNVKVDVYDEYFIIRNFMDAYGVDLQCWYQVDDSDEDNPQTLVYKYQIVGQEFGEDEIPGNVGGSYVVVNMEGYDLQMGMCNLNPMGGWLTIIASKLSDMENFYHYSLDFSPAVEVEKPEVTPAEGEYDELQTITIKFDQPVTIPVEDWENGVYYVPTPYIEGEATYAYESAALVAGEQEGEVIFTLEKPIVRGDVYTFTLPEGCVIFEDGSENPEFTYTYTITGNNFTVTTEEGETSMTITPASGSTVSVLEYFDVQLTGYVNIPSWEVDAALYDAEGEELCQASFNDNYDGTYSIELWKKVTKAGTYTLKFTVPNQNEVWEEIGRHDYEATYTVDGSEYVEMPYTITAKTAKMLETESESEVEFGQDVTVVIDEDNFVIKNLLGVEGFDLTANYTMYGSWCYVYALSAPGVEEPSSEIEVTPNEEIGTIGLAVTDAQLDPKGGKICVTIAHGSGEDATYSYCLLAWGTGLEETGVSTVRTTVSGKLYNLNGQAVKTPAKGIFIVNGKKVVM